MREIKFRALKDDISNCNLIYGSLVYSNGVPRISNDEGLTFHSCISGTEGQFIGLKDKKGNNIYDGDIYKMGGILHKVVFDNGAFCVTRISSYNPSPINWAGSGEDDLEIDNFCNRIEIIGNIHSNPELL